MDNSLAHSGLLTAQAVIRRPISEQGGYPQASNSGQSGYPPASQWTRRLSTGL
jgi:hypothetical protein